MRATGWKILLIALLAVGCRGRAARPASPAPPTPVTGLSEPVALADVEAVVVPPAGWRPDPLKASPQHKHQVWISPSGNTAYGVIRFALPLPVGEDAALWGFLREMKRVEGQATLRQKWRDPRTRSLNFVAEGGLYLVRGTIETRGFHGWAVYAGTLRNQPIFEEELELAVRARENTALGLPDPPGGSPAGGATGIAPPSEAQPASPTPADALAR